MSLSSDLESELHAAGLLDEVTVGALRALNVWTFEDAARCSEQDLLSAGVKPFKARKLMALVRPHPRLPVDRGPLPAPPSGAPPGYIENDPNRLMQSNPRDSTDSLPGGPSVVLPEPAIANLIAEADGMLESALELVKRREIDRAVEFCEKACAQYKTAMKQSPTGTPPPARTAAALGLATELCRRQNRLGEAEKFAKTLLKVQRRAKGEGHPATGDAHFALGRIQRKLGKLDQAGRSFGESLRVRLHSLGREDARTGSSFYYLGVAMEEQGRLDEALHSFVESLRVFRVTVGPEHRDTAEALNNVASVLYRLGQFGKAKEAYERALAVKIVVYGIGSSSVADTLYNLSLLLRDMHEQGMTGVEGGAGAGGAGTGPASGPSTTSLLSEAVSYALRALEASESANGPTDPRTEDVRLHVQDLERRQDEAVKAAVKGNNPRPPKRSLTGTFSRKR